MNALETICENNGTLLEEQYIDYSLWNYLTSYRSDGNHYEEGSAYITARTMRIHNAYPVENLSSSLDPTALGCNYILFNSAGNEGSLRLEFNGNDDDIWYTQIIKAVANNNHTYDIVALDLLNDGEYIVEDFGQYVWVALISDIVAGSEGDYLYSAYLDQTVIDEAAEAIPEFELLGNYPNPFNGRTVISLYSPSGDEADLTIYDITGRKVSSQSISLDAGLNNIAVDFEGSPAGHPASGVYYYRVVSREKTLTGNMLYLK
jgi:hypothetical protein